MATSGRKGCVEMAACSGGICKAVFCKAGFCKAGSAAVAGVGTRGSTAGRLQLVAWGGLWTRPR